MEFRMAKKRPPKGQIHDLLIVLIRHGQAGGDPVDPELGPPLTPLGLKQAERVGKRLSSERFAHIYASDLSRAHQTALAIRKHHRRTPFTVTPVLREIGGSMLRPGRDSGGRAVQEEIRRRRSQLDRFARQVVAKHKWDDRILVVGHGNQIRYLAAAFAGINPKRTLLFETSNTSVSEAVIQNGKFLWMYRTNDTRHLSPSQVT